MKIRNGFVSNSSSSSFVLDKEGLTKKQLEEVYKWIEQQEAMELEKMCINESNKHFFGTLDNCAKPSLEELLESLGVDKNKLDTGD